MNETKYIVYKITNRFDSKIYIGIHAQRSDNDRYMGSGTEIKEAIKKEGRKSFVKEILFVFDNKEEMLVKEKELVTKEFCMRVDTYNRIEGGGTYCTIGMVSVRDKDGNNLKVYNDDSRYISGELVANRKGNTVLSDKLKNDSEFEIKFKKQAGDNFRKAHKAGKIKYDVFKGKKHSVESKNKMSEKASLRKGKLNSQFGSCWITDGQNNKKVSKESFDSWVKEGWIKGRIIK